MWCGRVSSSAESIAPSIHRSGQAYALAYLGSGVPAAAMSAAAEGEAAQHSKLEVGDHQPLLETTTRSSLSSDAVVHLEEVPAEGDGSGKHLRLVRRAGIGAAVVLFIVGLAVRRTLPACGVWSCCLCAGHLGRGSREPARTRLQWADWEYARSDNGGVPAAHTPPRRRQTCCPSV